MEVLGGVAAILSLIKAARKVKEVAANLHQNLQQAPLELEELIERLELVHNQLQKISEYERRTPNSGLPATTLSIMQRYFASLCSKVTILENKYAKYNQQRKIRRQVGLALLDTTVMREYLQRLHELESMLGQHLLFLFV
jgi:hypothetical protein